jgi:hypothetical protein
VGADRRRSRWGCIVGGYRVYDSQIRLAAMPWIDHFGNELSPQRKSLYLMERHPLVDSRGFSCTPAPWGGIAAVNLNTLTKVWEKPLGTMIPGQETGIRNFGGPIVTASNLVITAGAEDLWLRVFDSASGGVAEGSAPGSGRSNAPYLYPRRAAVYRGFRRRPWRWDCAPGGFAHRIRSSITIKRPGATFATV